MNADVFNAGANVVVTAVLLLGSFFQMLSRASDFRRSEATVHPQLSGPALFAEKLNDRGSIIVAIGAYCAYLVAIIGLFVSVKTWDAGILYALIGSAAVVLFSTVMIIMLKLGKLDPSTDAATVQRVS